MFSYLYTLLCGKTIYPEYKDHIYPFIGLFTFLLAFALAFIFYIIIGRKWTVWYKTTHWIITMVVILFIAFAFAFNYAEEETGGNTPFDYTFAMVNTLYAFIYYILFSILLKRFSIFAKRTPF